MSNHGNDLFHADKTLKEDNEIVLSAWNKNGHAKICIKKMEIITIMNIIYQKIKFTIKMLKYSYNLKYASDNLKKDKDIVLTAVRKNGSALEYASEELKYDKDVVLATVIQNGLALIYASEELRNDKDVVLAAVNQNGDSLYYASKDLKSEKDVVLAAVTQNGLALGFSDQNLRSNKKLILVALNQNGFALKYASTELQNDLEILNILHNFFILPENKIEETKKDNQKWFEERMKTRYVLMEQKLMQDLIPDSNNTVKSRILKF